MTKRINSASKRDKPSDFDRTRGCLLGGAIGDALGAPIEFLTTAQICEKFGSMGIQTFACAYGRRGAITDDTQMTLFSAEGVIRARLRQGERGVCHVPGVVHHAYLRWLLTQGDRPTGIELQPDGWLWGIKALHHRRAPGSTCVSALRTATSFGEPAMALNDSKGCGGVMRAAPFGLFASAVGNDVRVFDLACETSALTHGHITGQLAAGCFAVLIAALLRGETLRASVTFAHSEVRRREGHDEVDQALEAALYLAKEGRRRPVDIETLGGGWVAEEAVAIAVCCALQARDFSDGVRLAVNHSGDSDSTGAMTGNLLGALGGIEAIPAFWLMDLEMREEIDRIARDLAKLALSDRPDDDDWTAYPGW